MESPAAPTTASAAVCVPHAVKRRKLFQDGMLASNLKYFGDISVRSSRWCLYPWDKLVELTVESSNHGDLFTVTLARKRKHLERHDEWINQVILDYQSTQDVDKAMEAVPPGYAKAFGMKSLIRSLREDLVSGRLQSNRDRYPCESWRYLHQKNDLMVTMFTTPLWKNLCKYLIYNFGDNPHVRFDTQGTHMEQLDALYTQHRIAHYQEQEKKGHPRQRVLLVEDLPFVKTVIIKKKPGMKEPGFDFDKYIQENNGIEGRVTIV